MGSIAAQQPHPTPAYSAKEEQRPRPAENGLLAVGFGDVADREMLDVFPDLVGGLDFDAAVPNRCALHVQNRGIDLLVQLPFIVVATDAVDDDRGLADLLLYIAMDVAAEEVSHPALFQPGNERGIFRLRIALKIKRGLMHEEQGRFVGPGIVDAPLDLLGIRRRIPEGIVQEDISNIPYGKRALEISKVMSE